MANTTKTNNHSNSSTVRRGGRKISRHSQDVATATFAPTTTTTTTRTSHAALTKMVAADRQSSDRTALTSSTTTSGSTYDNSNNSNNDNNNGEFIPAWKVSEVVKASGSSCHQNNGNHKTTHTPKKLTMTPKMNSTTTKTTISLYSSIGEGGTGTNVNLTIPNMDNNTVAGTEIDGVDHHHHDHHRQPRSRRRSRSREGRHHRSSSRTGRTTTSAAGGSSMDAGTSNDVDGAATAADRRSLKRSTSKERRASKKDDCSSHSKEQRPVRSRSVSRDDTTGGAAAAAAAAARRSRSISRRGRHTAAATSDDKKDDAAEEQRYSRRGARKIDIIPEDVPSLFRPDADLSTPLKRTVSSVSAATWMTPKTTPLRRSNSAAAGTGSITTTSVPFLSPQAATGEEESTVFESIGTTRTKSNKIKSKSSSGGTTRKKVAAAAAAPAAEITTPVKGTTTDESVAESVASRRVREKLAKAKKVAMTSPESVPSLFHSAVGVQKKEKRKKSSKSNKKTASARRDEEEEQQGDTTALTKKNNKKKSSNDIRKSSKPKKEKLTKAAKTIGGDKDATATAGKKRQSTNTQFWESYADFVADTDFADDVEGEDDNEETESISINESIQGFGVPITPLTTASKKKGILSNADDPFKVIQQFHESTESSMPLFELPTALAAAPKRKHRPIEQDENGFPVISIPKMSSAKKSGDHDNDDDDSQVSDVSSIQSENTDWTNDQGSTVSQQRGILPPPMNDHSTRSRRTTKTYITKDTTATNASRVSRASTTTSTVSTAWQLREQAKHQRRPTGRRVKRAGSGTNENEDDDDDHVLRTPATCPGGRRAKFRVHSDTDGGGGGLPPAFAGLTTPVRTQRRSYIAPLTPSQRALRSDASQSRRGSIAGSLAYFAGDGDDDGNDDNTSNVKNGEFVDDAMSKSSQISAMSRASQSSRHSSTNRRDRSRSTSRSRKPRNIGTDVKDVAGKTATLEVDPVTGQKRLVIDLGDVPPAFRSTASVASSRASTTSKRRGK